MRALHVFSSIALVAFVGSAAACDARSSVTTGSDTPPPGTGAAEPSEPSDAHAPSAPAARPPLTFAQRAERVDATAAGQDRLAALLTDALDAEDAAAVTLALHALGRNLSVYRSGRYEEPLVRSLQRFASAESEPVRAAVDGRAAIPLCEVLLDIRDRAALERISASYADGPAGARLTQMTDLAARVRPDMAMLTPAVDGACELLVDGEPVSGPVGVSFGSHTAACGDGPSWPFIADQPGYRIVQSGETLILVLEG